MFERLEVLRLAQGLAEHAAARQSVVARNVANADTPGYRQRDLSSFAEVWNRQAGANALKSTREGHFRSSSVAGYGRGDAQVVPGATADPNGNTVSVEVEIMKSAEVKQEHDLALSIYRSSLNVLRSSLGRR